MTDSSPARPTNWTTPDTPAGSQDPENGRKEPRRRSRARRGALVLAGALLTLVALVTGLRTFEIPGALPAMLVSFTPYALIGAVLAVLLAGLARSVLVLLVGVVFAVVHVLWLVPMYVPDGPAVRGHSTTVMSVNLWFGRADPAEVVDLVREHDVDILSVQELTPDAVRSLRRAGLDDLLAHRYVEPVAGAEGTGIWSARPLEPREFGGARPTRFENLRATVTTRGGVQVDVMAVHPFPPLPSSSEWWRADIGELVRVGEPGDRPMIMAGDFNATRDHLPMRQLAEQGLVDAADQAGAGYRPTWGPLGRVRLFEIDHVLVSGDDIATSSVSRHSIDGADHLAVVAELTISDASADR